jgi:hypothetical protein
MSAIYPAFESPLPSASDFNGNCLSRWLKRLNEISASANVTELSRFIDSGTMALEVLDDEQLAAMRVPPVAWHYPNDGLQTVRGLLTAIEEGKIRFLSPRGDETEVVLNELRNLEGLLSSASLTGNRFHLLVDM